MLTTLKSGLVAVALMAALCTPALSNAALSPQSETLAQQAQASNHLTHAVEALAAAAPLGYPSDDQQASRYAPRWLLEKPLSIELRGPSDLALWNLIATVHAQQKHSAFDLMDVGAFTVREIEREQVSAVPLPGVLWLFVTGLLGLAGTRTRRKPSAAWGAVATA
jgi:hypothetical protein